MSEVGDLDALAQQTHWLRGLARQLVRSSADADDLVQETLLTALLRKPAADGGLGAWLSRALRSRRVDTWRTHQAAAARERACARGDAQASTVDLVAKAESQRALVDAVLALGEPYRSTILLRFFERQTPRAIARRAGVPVATVQSRTQRALAMLRARLGAGGGRDRWLAAVLPLVRPRPFLSTWILGVSVMHGAVKVVGGLALVALAVWLWPTDPPAAPARSVAAEQPAEPAQVAASAASEPPAGERVAVEVPTPVRPPAATAAGDTARLLRGRVIDTQGLGIAGVPLAVEPQGAIDGADPRSGDGGRFELRLAARAEAIVTRDPRWATVLAGAARTGADRECIVMVAPRIELAGRVVDAAGAALPGAEVAVHVPAHLGADLGQLLDFTLVKHWRTTCGADGAFALPGVPVIANGTLAASLGGYLPRLQPLPRASDPGMTLILERPAASATVLSGVVLDALGGAVAGAHVSAGGPIAISDAAGAFELDVGADAMPRVVAVAAGWQPAVFEAPTAADGKPVWPPRLVLRLGPPPRAIAGRVVDGEGRPVGGAKVWVADPLLLGVHDGDVLLAETVLGRDDRPFWAAVRTDAEGRFELRGLLDRTYRVGALDTETLLAAERRIAAGATAAEIVLPGAVHAEIRGHVRARDGTPIADVAVKVHRPALEVQVPGGTRDQWADLPAVRTDRDGAFTLRRVARDGVEVFASGDAILFAGVKLDADTDVRDLVITVDRRVHLQVELAPPYGRADTLRVHDAADRPMLLRVMRGETSYTNRTAKLVDGRSQILSVGEGAVAVVLRLGEREVARIPVALQPGPTTTVRW